MVMERITLLESAKDAFAHLVFFGVTQQTMIDMKAIVTMVIVGGVSAFGGSFLTARDNAFELKQYSKAQEEFRTEMRLYMRESTLEVRSLADRMTRQEIITSSGVQGGMSGMFGPSGVHK